MIAAKLQRRHPKPALELSPKVVLGIETAAAGDLADPHVTTPKHLRCLVEPLLFEKLTEHSPRRAMKSPGDVVDTAWFR